MNDRIEYILNSIRKWTACVVFFKVLPSPITVAGVDRFGESRDSAVLTLASKSQVFKKE